MNTKIVLSAFVAALMMTACAKQDAASVDTAPAAAESETMSDEYAGSTTEPAADAAAVEAAPAEGTDAAAGDAAATDAPSTEETAPQQ